MGKQLVGQRSRIGSVVVLIALVEACCTNLVATSVTVATTAATRHRCRCKCHSVSAAITSASLAAASGSRCCSYSQLPAAAACTAASCTAASCTAAAAAAALCFGCNSHAACARSSRLVANRYDLVHGGPGCQLF